MQNLTESNKGRYWDQKKKKKRKEKKNCERERG